jgi:hypothetical protein
MTQAALFGDAVPPTAKPVDEERDDFCSCGHSRDHHVSLKHACQYGMSSRIFDPVTKRYRSGSCGCERFTTKKRAPKAKPVGFDKPAAGCDWYRGPPEIVRRKVGGWYVVSDTSLRVLIFNTKLVSENVIRKRAAGNLNPDMARRIIAGDANTRKAHQYRIIAALEQARCSTRGTPRSASITRIGSPRIKDDDNLISACKHVRDGIAEALEIDDGCFNVNGGTSSTGGTVPLFYKQATSGKRKAYAVLIELAW